MVSVQSLESRMAHVRDVIEIQRQSVDYLGHRSRARALDGILYVIAVQREQRYPFQASLLRRINQETVVV